MPFKRTFNNYAGNQSEPEKDDVPQYEINNSFLEKKSKPKSHNVRNSLICLFLSAFAVWIVARNADTELSILGGKTYPDFFKEDLVRRIVRKKIISYEDYLRFSQNQTYVKQEPLRQELQNNQIVQEPQIIKDSTTETTPLEIYQKPQIIQEQHEEQQIETRYEQPVVETKTAFQNNQNIQHNFGGLEQRLDEDIDWNYWNWWDFESGEWKRLENIAVRINREPYIETFTHSIIDHFLILDVSVRALKEVKDIDFILNFDLRDESGNNARSSSILIDGTNYLGYDMYEKLNPRKMKRIPYGLYSDKSSVGAAKETSISRKLPFLVAETYVSGGGSAKHFKPISKGIVSFCYQNSSIQVSNLDWQESFTMGPKTDSPELPTLPYPLKPENFPNYFQNQENKKQENEQNLNPNMLIYSHVFGKYLTENEYKKENPWYKGIESLPKGTKIMIDGKIQISPKTGESLSEFKIKEKAEEKPASLAAIVDNFSQNSAGNYASNYFSYQGSGLTAITCSIINGKLHIQNIPNDCYNHSLIRRNEDYIIPEGMDFDFSVDVNRRDFDSYRLGIAFWSDFERTKFLEVNFDDYMEGSSNITTHLGAKYGGGPNNPSNPFNVMVKRRDSIYSCWIDGIQIFDGSLNELDGEDLIYGVMCSVTSGSNCKAYADYDNWSFSVTKK